VRTDLISRFEAPSRVEALKCFRWPGIFGIRAEPPVLKALEPQIPIERAKTGGDKTGLYS